MPETANRITSILIAAQCCSVLCTANRKIFFNINRKPHSQELVKPQTAFKITLITANRSLFFKPQTAIKFPLKPQTTTKKTSYTANRKTLSPPPLRTLFWTRFDNFNCQVFDITLQHLWSPSFSSERGVIIHGGSHFTLVHNDSRELQFTREKWLGELSYTSV